MHAAILGHTLNADSIILGSPVGAITLWILPSNQHHITLLSNQHLVAGTSCLYMSTSSPGARLAAMRWCLCLQVVAAAGAGLGVADVGVASGAAAGAVAGVAAGVASGVAEAAAEEPPGGAAVGAGGCRLMPGPAQERRPRLTRPWCNLRRVMLRCMPHANENLQLAVLPLEPVC